MQKKGVLVDEAAGILQIKPGTLRQRIKRGRSFKTDLQGVETVDLGRGVIARKYPLDWRWYVIVPARFAR